MTVLYTHLVPTEKSGREAQFQSEASFIALRMKAQMQVGACSPFSLSVYPSLSSCVRANVRVVHTCTRCTTRSYTHPLYHFHQTLPPRCTHPHTYPPTQTQARTHTLTQCNPRTEGHRCASCVGPRAGCDGCEGGPKRDGSSRATNHTVRHIRLLTFTQCVPIYFQAHPPPHPHPHTYMYTLTHSSIPTHNTQNRGQPFCKSCGATCRRLWGRGWL